MKIAICEFSKNGIERNFRKLAQINSIYMQEGGRERRGEREREREQYFDGIYLGYR